MPRMPGVPFHSVPHFNNGRGANVNLVVMHQFAGGTVAAVQNWLRNPASRVSYHFGVGRNGEIRQWVETRNTAWATGPANARSIAIGCEGTNQNFTEAQLTACARIIRWARGAHSGIPRNDGIGWHRQFMQTNCPGDPKIRQIPELRRRANQSAPTGTRHVADGTISLAEFARRRNNTRPQVIVDRSFRGEPGPGSLNQVNRTRMAEYLAGGATRTMPNGLVYWTANPAPAGGRWVADGRESLAQVAARRNTSALNLIRVSFSTNPLRLNTVNRRRMALYLTDGGGANTRMPRGLVLWTVN
jgi:hypothetical protein